MLILKSWHILKFIVEVNLGKAYVKRIAQIL